MSEPDDPTAVRETLAGDPSRFAVLVQRHDRAVRSVVEGRVRDPNEIEELVQQTFYLAFRRLDQLADPARFGAWLERIAENCAAEHHRRLARREREADLTGLEAAAGDRSAEWIWGEVERLPAPQREVLELRYRLDLTYAEIAARLAVPVSTVRGRIYEARRALRRRLSPPREP
ncbi:MAG: sigma-70 family RNA polymerase sigma factor [Planctomycetota bacterium]